MSFRAIIVDDEPLARERLRRLLAADAEIEVVRECRNGGEAITTLRQTSVDLVLLDIEMPGINGFAVIREIGAEQMPAVIFVTAHDSYAVKAFEVQALDYLMKPVEPQRLREAVGRVKDRLRSRAGGAPEIQLRTLLEKLESRTSPQKTYGERLLVPHGIKQVFVRVDEIDWIEAADYYAVLHVGSKIYTLRQTIKQLAQQLDPKRFVRIHRSAIVNLCRVKEIIHESVAENWVVLSAGQKIKMSKGGRRMLLQRSDLGRE
ncbi:MAG TPA: LytTR family DNA-binding domain-containing protein [Steroidobacteraceae bacterium]|nr:LytTR family DNA-binding domain-containing protein [Steroidobacteraceae bacterium]